MLKEGATGLPVRRLQSRMSTVGFDTGGVDGRFGAKTEAALRKLQHDFNLTVTASSARRPGRQSTRWRMRAARAEGRVREAGPHPCPSGRGVARSAG